MEFYFGVPLPKPGPPQPTPLQQFGNFIFGEAKSAGGTLMQPIDNALLRSIGRTPPSGASPAPPPPVTSPNNLPIAIPADPPPATDQPITQSATVGDTTPLPAPHVLPMWAADP